MDQANHNRPAATGSSAEMEWRRIVETTDGRIRAIVAGLVAQDVDRCVEVFYATLLDDPEAAPFLDHKVVSERLHLSLRGWMIGLFRSQNESMEAFADRQRTIGEVHARIRLPIHLVMQGARLLKTNVTRDLLDSDLDREALWHAQLYVDAMIDLAMALMSEAFFKNTTRNIRTDEAYRLFSLGQDLSLERESQRAALMEWSHAVLLALHANPGQAARLPAIGRSEFGLWLHHKASVLFQGAPMLDRIQALMDRIDGISLPAMAEARDSTPEELPQLIENFQAEFEEIKFLLTEMFQTAAGLESGRDPLTRTLNRRFLPSILTREIATAAQHRATFSILMIDVDHFKTINDQWGHPIGDAILKQVAGTILEACRLGDFVFRYGGEEFLILIVEADGEAAIEKAERIRETVARQEFQAPTTTRLQVTVSIGVAEFNGHPDHERLVQAADQALYKAKEQGRNQVVLAG
ncbi:diguanylate cyclase [Microvirga flavescens]|uniref:diguanylate cyclase n=1 Tax=Microvirga flavescens TaxID=2249811 RepID=UPI000DD84055|nr:diguanylate cyclase [Microvirga flavescens]